MTVRRDRVPLTTAIPNESWIGWALEPEVRINLATRVVSGYIRFYGPSKKFLKSEAYEFSLGETKIEGVADAIATKLINLKPVLAGTRIVEEIADVDQDPP